jgi:hypothetical protein
MGARGRSFKSLQTRLRPLFSCAQGREVVLYVQGLQPTASGYSGVSRPRRVIFPRSGEVYRSLLTLLFPAGVSSAPAPEARGCFLTTFHTLRYVGLRGVEVPKCICPYSPGFLDLEVWETRLHIVQRASDLSSSRKPDFRHTQFSEPNSGIGGSWTPIGQKRGLGSLIGAPALCCPKRFGSGARLGMMAL